MPSDARTLRLLTLADMDEYLRFFNVQRLEGGVDGRPHDTPYNRNEVFDPREHRAVTTERWETPIHTLGWRRVWGLFEDDALIGTASLTGHTLETTAHRAQLGMGILYGYHRQGLGTRLLQTVIDWCRDQPQLCWLDLGVFHENKPAIGLYEAFGFQRLGYTPDLFRIDGVSIDDIPMTLWVGPDGA